MTEPITSFVRSGILSTFNALIEILPILTLLVATGLLYSRTTSTIIAEWINTSTYSHGLLVVPVVFYLFWLDRSELERSRRIAVLPMLGLCVCMAVWSAASVVNILALETVALFGLFVSALGLYYGLKFWRTGIAPLAALLLALPFWDFLQIPLQTISAAVTQWVLILLEIPTFRDGFLFTVPGGRFHIEEACSGLGFLLSSILLAIIYAKMFRLRNFDSFLLVILAASVALLSNWLRISVIMVVGNETEMNHPIVEDHLTFGWILFAFMLGIFLWIADRLTRPGRDYGGESALSNSISAETADVNRMLIVIALLACAPVSIALTTLSMDTEVDEITQRLEELLPRNPEPKNPVDWQPTFHGAASVDSYYSEYSGEECIVLIVRYGQQSQGKELIYVENTVYDKSRWRLIDRFELSGFSLLQLEERRGRQRQVAYSYLVNNTMTSSGSEAKFQELMGFLRGSSSSYLVAIATEGEMAESSERLAVIGSVVREHLLTNSNSDSK